MNKPAGFIISGVNHKQLIKSHAHLAHAFVDISLLWQRRQLARCQLQKPDIALLCRDLSLDNADLLLRGNGLRLDFLDELDINQQGLFLFFLIHQKTPYFLQSFRRNRHVGSVVV
jgi:hypothetical protein